jgi:hypothetical protein
LALMVPLPILNLDSDSKDQVLMEKSDQEEGEN